MDKESQESTEYKPDEKLKSEGYTPDLSELTSCVNYTRREIIITFYFDKNNKCLGCTSEIIKQ